MVSTTAPSSPDVARYWVTERCSSLVPGGQSTTCVAAPVLTASGQNRHPFDRTWSNTLSRTQPETGTESEQLSPLVPLGESTTSAVLSAQLTTPGSNSPPVGPPPGQTRFLAGRQGGGTDLTPAHQGDPNPCNLRTDPCHHSAHRTGWPLDLSHGRARSGSPRLGHANKVGRPVMIRHFLTGRAPGHDPGPSHDHLRNQSGAK